MAGFVDDALGGDAAVNLVEEVCVVVGADVFAWRAIRDFIMSNFILSHQGHRDVTPSKTAKSSLAL